ncbi:MAG: hypothetical protein ACUVRK_05505 [Spirochaetota bacterium]
MIIKLLPNGHCIETAVKEELQKLLDAMFNSPTEDHDLKEQYQLLYDLIHTVDFKKLRASDKRFTGIVPVTCEIYRDDTGKPAIKILNSNILS